MAHPALSGAFLRFLLHNYHHDRCLRSASALCYTTLLSLVPLTAVVFSVFAAFPVFEGVATDLQAFVFQNFNYIFENTIEFAKFQL